MGDTAVLPSNAGRPNWHTVPIDPEALAHYGRCLGFATPTESLTALGQAILNNPDWPQIPHGMLVCRPSPTPLLAFWGCFDDNTTTWLQAQTQELNLLCGSLVYADYPQVENDCRALAEQLRQQLGEEALGQAQFMAIPRGGLVILGLLSILLRLQHHQLTPAGDPSEELLVVVDDCALSGHRFRQTLAQQKNRQVVFAHLYSHPDLRQALTQQEERVIACISARDLHEEGTAHLAEGWRQRWMAQDSTPRYWIGRPQPLAFPWGETDRNIWHPSRQRQELAWRLVPPQRCLKNQRLKNQRPTTTPPMVIQIQSPSKGPLAPSPSVVYGEFEQGVAIAHLENGTSLGLTGSAGQMWCSLVRNGTISGAMEELKNEYEVSETTLRQDLEAFVEQLIARDLLIDNRSPTANV